MRRFGDNLNVFYYGVLILVVGAVLVIWLSQLGGLWIHGISYVADNREGFHNTAHPIEGEYTVEIDLLDLESNVGKELYSDGHHQIYVSRVVEHDDTYQLFFRSSGPYSMTEATLVSGVEYVRTDYGLTNEFVAEAKALYSGESYSIERDGTNGLEYRDGDEFVFFLEPKDEEMEIDLSEEHVMEVTVTNLRKNYWVKY